MKNFANSRVGAVAIGAAILVVAGGTGAFAASMVTSSQIKNGTIRSRDIATSTQDNSTMGVRQDNLSSYLQGQVKSIGGKADQTYVDSQDKNLQGQVNDTTKSLEAGADYTHTWPGDNGQNLNTIVQKCPSGQVATGGGYSTFGGSDTNAGGTPYDLGGDNKNIQVTVSAPYSEDTYDPNKYDGNIRPTEWVIKGYNNGSTDQVVRAWVVCAQVNGSGQ